MFRYAQHDNRQPTPLFPLRKGRGKGVPPHRRAKAQIPAGGGRCPAQNLRESRTIPCKAGRTRRNRISPRHCERAHRASVAINDSGQPHTFDCHEAKASRNDDRRICPLQKKGGGGNMPQKGCPARRKPRAKQEKPPYANKVVISVMPPTPASLMTRSSVVLPLVAPVATT